MRQWFIVFASLLCVSAMRNAAAQTPRSAITVAMPSFARNHILVKFKAAEIPKDVSALAATEPRLANAALGLPAGCRIQESGFARAMRVQALARGKQIRNDVDFSRYVYLTVPEGRNAAEWVEEISHNPLVTYAELDPIGTGGATTPNDPDFGSQWHHDNASTPSADISSREAWDISQGSSNVVVAVLDTGLNMALSEFSGRVVSGWDFANVDANPTDDHGHGTAVSGTLGARGNNGTLVAGMDWNCRIMPIKVLDSSNSGYYSWWTDGIDFAIAQGADIISLSAGGFISSTTLGDAVERAIAAGLIFVSITHNDGNGNVRFPGRLASSITVGNTDQTDARWSTSNYGPSIDLCAPGRQIYTVSKANTLQSWTGTSIAGALVAGVCALMKSVYPDLNQESALKLLIAGAEDQVGSPTEDVAGFDDYHGWGRLNANSSLMLASALPMRITPTVMPSGVQNVPYNRALSVAGGEAPHTWKSITSYIETTNASSYFQSGVAMGWKDDDGWWELALPFPFPFYGQVYTNCYVDSNGKINFDEGNSDPSALSTDFDSSVVIAPYWADLKTDGFAIGAEDIYVLEDGASITIRWRAELNLDSSPANFSVKLSADGSIRFAYGPNNDSVSFIGISAGDGTNSIMDPDSQSSTMGNATDRLFTYHRLPEGLSISSNGHVAGTPLYGANVESLICVEDSTGISEVQNVLFAIDADTDGDQLGDSWELTHFGNLTNASATSNSDGDDASDAAEFAAGTNPTNANDFLGFTDVRFDPASPRSVLSWRSVSNKVYDLMRLTNLTSASYMTIASNCIATPPLNVYTDQSAVGSMPTYYNLRVK